MKRERIKSFPFFGGQQRASVIQTIALLFALLALSAYYHQLHISNLLREQISLRAQITTAVDNLCVKTHEANTLCLEQLTRVRQLVDYRQHGHEYNVGGPECE